MSSGSAPPKRQYDARRRRERAAEERRATSNRVLDAATRLFVAKGYTATTMADIAREAGVAMQSVYTAGRSKADLLSAAVERAVAGDDQEVMVHERPAVRLMAEEPDPIRQMQMAAAFVRDIQERSEPMQVAYREAAAVDVKVAAAVEAAHRRRRETVGFLIAADAGGPAPAPTRRVCRHPVGSGEHRDAPAVAHGPRVVVAGGGSVAGPDIRRSVVETGVVGRGRPGPAGTSPAAPR